MIVIVSPDNVLSSTRGPAEAFFTESQIDGKLSMEHFVKTWENFIRLDMGQILVYRRDIDAPSLGIIGGIVSPCPMTADIVATEMFWWVEPELRKGSRAGLQLLQSWLSWAKAKGARRAYVGNLIALNDSKMQSLYQKMGFKPLEVHYVQNL